MKKIFGIIILIIAIATLCTVFAYILKKGFYQGDFWHLLIDSVEFVVLIIAHILVGIILLTGH